MVFVYRLHPGLWPSEDHGSLPGDQVAKQVYAHRIIERIWHEMGDEIGSVPLTRVRRSSGWDKCSTQPTLAVLRKFARLAITKILDRCYGHTRAFGPRWTASRSVAWVSDVSQVSGLDGQPALRWHQFPHFQTRRSTAYVFLMTHKIRHSVDATNNGFDYSDPVTFP